MQHGALLGQVGFCFSEGIKTDQNYFNSTFFVAKLHNPDDFYVLVMVTRKLCHTTTTTPYLGTFFTRRR